MEDEWISTTGAEGQSIQSEYVSFLLNKFVLNRRRGEPVRISRRGSWKLFLPEFLLRV
jgi:hypothetical protein